jgi:hypothetical protein
MQKTVPDFSPLMAGDHICCTCGEVMKREVMKSRRGVESIRFTCFNKETGCSYKIEERVHSLASPESVRPPVEEQKKELAKA